MRADVSLDDNQTWSVFEQAIEQLKEHQVEEVLRMLVDQHLHEFDHINTLNALADIVSKRCNVKIKVKIMNPVPRRPSFA